MQVLVSPNNQVKHDGMVYAAGESFQLEDEDQANALLEAGAVQVVKQRIEKGDQVNPAEETQPAEGEPSDDQDGAEPSLNELRAEAKSLNLSAGGTKEELAARIAEAKAN